MAATSRRSCGIASLVGSQPLVLLRSCHDLSRVSTSISNNRLEMWRFNGGLLVGAGLLPPLFGVLLGTSLALRSFHLSATHVSCSLALRLSRTDTWLVESR